MWIRIVFVLVLFPSFFSRQFEVLKKKKKKNPPPPPPPTPEVAIHCNYRAEGDVCRGGCVVLTCMNPKCLSLGDGSFFYRISACCIHISFVCFQNSLSRPLRVEFFFCLYLLYVTISYLYSSVVGNFIVIFFFPWLWSACWNTIHFTCCFENKCAKRDKRLVRHASFLGFTHSCWTYYHTVQSTTKLYLNLNFYVRSWQNKILSQQKKRATDSKSWEFYWIRWKHTTVSSSHCVWTINITFPTNPSDMFLDKWEKKNPFFYVSVDVQKVPKLPHSCMKFEIQVKKTNQI